MSKPPKPLMLCILDGWGHREEKEHNAIAQARTPNWDRFLNTYPHSLLMTSGEAVGLPEGQMGNSEVGHMTIGSGRIIFQDLPRIDRAIQKGELQKHPVLTGLVASLKKSGNAIHITGLCSDGGVHAHIAHIQTLIEMFGSAGIPVWVHVITDGRDTAPKGAQGYLKQLQATLARFPSAKIATVSGRYYAMDRDNRWERVEKAARAMIEAKAEIVATAEESITAQYAANVTDEFLLPRVVKGYAGMQAGDALLMANFRADRARQILQVFTDQAFAGFDRGAMPTLSACIGMVEYSTQLSSVMQTLFPTIEITQSLADVLAAKGLKQLRVAETEKYAHVTFFLSGGREEPLAGETRIMIPSPKVATYDVKPEMSAFEVTDALEKAIASGEQDVIIVNYANGDMVGHTGSMQAAIQAVEAIDQCLGRLEKAILAAGGAMLVTADHGNVEMMLDEHSGDIHTQHTTGPVPCVGVGLSGHSLRNGGLSDIAPTMLHLLGIQQPDVMTGKNLVG